MLEVKSKRLAFFDKLDAEEPRQYLKQHEKLTKVSDQVFYLDNADKFTDKEYFKVSNTNLAPKRKPIIKLSSCDSACTSLTALAKAKNSFLSSSFSVLVNFSS